ncbi:S-adenosyl-L-methionine-dependent methyltransferase [Rhodocollybia butyracea]|uniref:S-adenosyl-L-methionine-dependent methyltransferase n=1 Tax=Rhodocollybia butyracea TaxID=206335 RepID=A0A9P5PYC8_9AGAR|nr:S-adenosyl-L-methionine-dependent methyltransferase [Rhodocollybia butyracea]
MAVDHADGRSDTRIQNYTKFWKKDTSKEGDADNTNRLDSYTEVVNGYYDGATDLYEWGWAQSFHFSRFSKGESFAASLARHEHFLAAKMNIKPGMRVLDVGCGVGGPAREIATFTDANIVGLNNNEFQVGRARKYTKNMGLEGQVSFVKGDFMKLAERFGENSFDAVYAIEATVHAPTWEGVYGEIFKVLKPGGVFGVYEWCMTDIWDPSIPEHKALAHEIELGNGIPEMRSLKLARQALKDVGFNVEYEEDLAERKDHVEWYYPLEGDYSKAQTFYDLFTVWRTTWFGMFVMHNIMWFLELFGILPKGTLEVGAALKVAQSSLIKGGQTKLFTPMYLAIARKPAN